MSSLHAAAFGDRPDQVVPASPTDPHERWLAAVVLGAQGWYARAAALLDELRHHSDPVLAALASATLASHRRQLGGHANARHHDATALARLSRPRSPSDPPGGVVPLDRSGDVRSNALVDRPAEAGGDAGLGSPGGVVLLGRSGDARSDASLDRPGAVGAASVFGRSGEARADVLLGLAADAVGLGRTDEARRLVAAAPADAGWRAAVRTGWVSAEIELGAGRPAAAVRHAEPAAERAAASGSVRHRVKSALVLGAALAVSGRRERAGRLVSTAFGDATDLGLLTLVWPAAMIRAELEPTRADQFRRCAALALHSVLRRADPVGRRLAGRSPWVPRLAGPTG